MSGTERSVPVPSINYHALDHAQLKAMTDSVDPAYTQDFIDAWKDVGAGLSAACKDLLKVLADSEAGWTGSAAEAMRAKLKDVALWSAETGTRISGASAMATRQNEAAEVARNTMPEPVPYSARGMLTDAANSGSLVQLAMLPTTTQDEKERHDDAHAQAVQVLAERDEAMNAAGTTTATVTVFAPPPKLTESGGDTEGGMIDSDDYRDTGDSGGPGNYSGPGGDSGYGGGPGTSTPYPGGNPGTTAPGSGNGPSSTTTPGSVTPPVREPGPVGQGSFVPPGGTSNYGGGVGPGGFGPGGGGPGGGGPRGGGFGPGPGGGSSGNPGPGRAAPGPVGAPVEGAAARGSVAGARGGAPGMGGMPMGGGAGKGKDGETEHQRASYLEEPDPDGLFDSDVLTAPPVIGGPDDDE